ncbi:uncharacterized protein LOC121870120 isoform X2 [Homarus americanus]|uniref:uncharacterized protein LOC121870120 isoform X2 n=1 Tax=Homarus americanus TaxID=6706 RepID=UPI001C485B3F|nr:uncharacterized protein LOC121870120 isoform X2 [Homarus americanus]
MEFPEDFTHKNDACFHCTGFYGPNFIQPLCTTCHSFLYPDDPSKLPSVGPYQEKTDDGDSGNEEPREPGDYYQTQEQVQQPQQQQHYQLHHIEQQFQQQAQQQEGSVGTNVLVNSETETDDYDFVEGAAADSMDVGISESPIASAVELSGAGISTGMSGTTGGQPLASIAGTSGTVSVGILGSMVGGAAASVGVNSSAGMLAMGSSGGGLPGATGGLPGAGGGLPGAGGGLPGAGGGLSGPGGGLSGRNIAGQGGGGGSLRLPDTRRPLVMNADGRMVAVRETLQEQIINLTCPRPPENLDPTLIHRMPPEVWVLVFDLLDDMTLWSVGRVCRRWQELVNRYVSDDQWQKYTQCRWPLYTPLFKDVPWQMVYTKLTESAPCHMCLHQMSLLTPPHNSENSWRRNRLRNELRTLRSDPPEGIQASPLDKMSLHWQASIRGPGGSPYEGGTFFLYIQIPHSYPLCPPIVRFITKIFHPNVSRHGDIGIDSIQHNWSLALTISKVLISIQSLLTDPYTKVCMEPEIGRLYDTDKKQFECVATSWTWKHAMHDALIPEPVQTPTLRRSFGTCGTSSGS